MLIASSSDKIAFNNWPNLEAVESYELQDKVTEQVNSISWSKDGSWLIYVTDTGTAEIVSVKNTLKLLYAILEVEEISCAAFSNNTKRFLAIGTSTGSALLYDIKNKCERKRFQRLKSPIFKVAYVATDTHVLASCASSSDELALFSTANAALMAVYRLQSGLRITNFRCHPSDRALVAVATTSGAVSVWNWQSNKTLSTYCAHDSQVSDAIFVPLSADLLASIGLDRQLCFFDLLSNRRVLKVPVHAGPTCLDVCPQTGGLVVGTEAGTLLAYDIRNMKEAIEAHKVHASKVKQALFQKVNFENIAANEDQCVDFTPRLAESDLFKSEHFMKSESVKKFEPSASQSDPVLNKVHELKQGSITEGVRKLLSHKPDLLLLEKPTSAPEDSRDARKVEDATSKAEMKKIDTLREEIMFEMQDLRSYMNMRFLDIQMALVKEFLQVEYEFNALKDCLSAMQVPPENFLLQENLKLKQENEELRSKLQDSNSFH